MKMRHLKSSNIFSVGYDDKAAFLAVQFKRKEGSVTYTYPGIPRRVYEGLLDADSPGKFFNEHVRGAPFTKQED
jgi:hypothetical protein